MKKFIIILSVCLPLLTAYALPRLTASSFKTEMIAAIDATDEFLEVVECGGDTAVAFENLEAAWQPLKFYSDLIGEVDLAWPNPLAEGSRSCEAKCAILFKMCGGTWTKVSAASCVSSHYKKCIAACPRSPYNKWKIAN